MAHVLIVCARRYNGHELWTSLGVLQEHGHTFEVVSTSRLIMDEVTFQKNKIAKVLDDVPSLEGFDALIFISGNMADTEAYWDDPRTLNYVREAKGRDIPIAAICCSVPTIREAAGGKRVSYFPLVRSTDRLSVAGAQLQTVSISVDGKLVTAEHQMATQVWIEQFCLVLEGKPSTLHLQDSGFTPGGWRKYKHDPALERIRKATKTTGRTKLEDIPGK